MDAMATGSGPYSRALVTGGAGFIGSRLVEALTGTGCAVTVLDDLSSGRADSLPEEVSLIEMDIADPATVRAVASVRPELVIHAAAQVSVPRSVADPERDRAVNLTGTRHVLDGARDGAAQRFVFVSSGGAVYGDTALAREETAPAPANPYGRHKLGAEGAVADSGLSYGVVRFANVYGPGQRADLEGGVVSIFATALREGRPVTIFGTGNQVRDLLYVDDAVSGALAIADARTSGTWNVATGTPTSIRDLLDLLAARIAPILEVRFEPVRPGDVNSSCLSIERIRRELGWTPRYAVAEGLQAMLARS
ncbi:MAG: NAD-dependent epimerase/dehydratase family protein [Chloroflexota bacterium]|nr:NAD-dependent epimerase/dehydratase family protein [Chloroflexota bacterium]